MCFRASDRGTVSSSIVALRGTLTDSTYLHAQGPPCQTPYDNYARMLQDLKAKSASRRTMTHGMLTPRGYIRWQKSWCLPAPGGIF